MRNYSLAWFASLARRRVQIILGERREIADYCFIRSLDAAIDREDELQLMILEQETAIAYACR